MSDSVPVFVQEYGDFDPHQVKHLEMIQAVVARLGSNAFLIKGWAITVSGAFVGFAVDRNQWELAAASVVPTFLFWMLDASFLRNERLFRDLFARVTRGEETPFFMGATGQSYVTRTKAEARHESKDDVSSRFRTFWRETLVLFYGAVIVMALVVAVVICRF